MMLIDGRPATTVPASDRGLNYGDGLFETVRIHAGELPLFERHLARLRDGCRRLGLPHPGDDAIRADARALLADGALEGVLRIVLTHGDGGRGYAPPVDTPGRRIVSLHTLPAGLEGGMTAGVCETRLGDSPALGGLKHLGRLEQVLAARETAVAGWDEGLMLDASGWVVEGTRHNLFYWRNGHLYTPPLRSTGVAGVMRALVLESLPRAGVPGGEARLRYDDLHAIEGLLLCNAVAGLRVVERLEGRALGEGGDMRELKRELRAAGVAWLG